MKSTVLLLQLCIMVIINWTTTIMTAFNDKLFLLSILVIVAVNCVHPLYICKQCKMKVPTFLRHVLSVEVYRACASPTTSCLFLFLSTMFKFVEYEFSQWVLSVLFLSMFYLCLFIYDIYYNSVSPRGRRMAFLTSHTVHLTIFMSASALRSLSAWHQPQLIVLSLDQYFSFSDNLLRVCQEELNWQASKSYLHTSYITTTGCHIYLANLPQ